MKKLVLLFVALSIFGSLKSQSNSMDSIDLNLLNAPSNPAFNLMGISPTSIDKPTDLNAFRLSIQNATNSFTKLPSSYAVEISPASIFDKRSQTLQQFNSTKFSDVFWQSLSVSIGFSQSNADDKETNDSTSFSKLGFGLKVSLIRPPWSSKTSANIDSFYMKLKLVDKEYEKIAEPIYKANEAYKKLQIEITRAPDDKVDSLVKVQKKLKQTLIDSVKQALKNDAFVKLSVDLKEYAKGLKVDRKGLFLDFATGVAIDFPDNRFDNSLVSKAGAWLTGGYENGGNGFTALAIGRYLYQPDKIFADDSGTIKTKNISTVDGGARLVYNGLQGKFSVSAEAIYRSVLNDNIIKPNWRFTFNAEYNVGFNQKLTLAIGKNFDGTVTKSGNLIAALNFIRGFGSNKKITPPSAN